MVAVDVQNFHNPSQGLIDGINQLSTQIPTIATLYKHNEDVIPLSKLGHKGPNEDTCLVDAQKIYYKYGYTLPMEIIQWLKEQDAEEVILTGGHTDSNVLATGFCLFDAGFIPIIIPLLCYGNDWYMHTVSTSIWNDELGKVYESLTELGL